MGAAKTLRTSISGFVQPPAEGSPSLEEGVVYFSLVKGTRTYIEKVVHQINGAYSKGWYDAALVMIRRLLETLIIEVYEAHKIEAKIKDGNGNYLYLRDLISALVTESSWTLGRTVKQTMPKLKDVGDKSAHSRRFNAHRQDVENIVPDLRMVVQELVYLAKLK